MEAPILGLMLGVHFQRGFLEGPAWAVGFEVPLETGGSVFCELVVVGGCVHNFGGQVIAPDL
jgi:hypothetical protein